MKSEFDFVRSSNNWDAIDNYNKWIHRSYRKHIGKTVLEIGCGSGIRTYFLLNENCVVIATDISEDCVNFCKEKFNARNNFLNAYCLSIENDNEGIDRLKKENIDTIVCVNVLEHIENDIKAITNMKNILAPNGKIIIFVPAFSWLYSYLDKNIGHFRRYDRGALKKAAHSVGLKVVDNFYFNFFGIPLIYFKGKLFPSKKSDIVFSDVIINENSSKLINFFSPLFCFIENIIRPYCGISEVIILQKKK